ncbi:unnamed protein product [Camellia sinensis]
MSLSLSLSQRINHSYYPLGSLESIVNPVQPTLATEDMGAGRFTLNISRVNGSVAIDTGIVHGLESNVIRSRNSIRSGWEWRTEIRSCFLLYSIVSIGMYKNQLQELA